METKLVELQVNDEHSGSPHGTTKNNFKIDLPDDTTNTSDPHESVRQRKGDPKEEEDETYPEEFLPRLSEADIKRLRVRSLLGDGEIAAEGGVSILTHGDRAYIVFWIILWTVVVFGLYWYFRRDFGSGGRQQYRMYVYFAAMGVCMIFWIIIAIFPFKIRTMIMECLFGRDWEDKDDGVTEFYEGVKLWLLFPISVLGLWAPKSVPKWFRVIHLTLCFSGLAVLVGFEVVNILSRRGPNVAQNVTWLLYEITEVFMFVTGLIVYRNEKFVSKLFLFDNTKVHDDETFAESHHVVSKKKLKKEIARDFSPRTPDDSATLPTTFSISSLSSQVTMRTQHVIERQRREGQISVVMIQSAWRWVVKVITPIVVFSVVAWIGSIAIDTIGWYDYGPHGVWMSVIYAISPLSGTNYFVTNLFISGAGYIISTHIWFTCYSVSMELNRIVIQLSEGLLTVSDLLEALRGVRERMEYLFEKAQYIIVYQVWFAAIMMAFVAIEFFKILPNSQPLIRLDAFTMISVFSFITQAIITVAFAANIFRQHRTIVNVVRVQQEIQLSENKKNSRDLTGLVSNLQNSPVGLRVCRVYLNQQFLQRLIVLALSQAGAVVYRQFSSYINTGS